MDRINDILKPYNGLDNTNFITIKARLNRIIKQEHLPLMINIIDKANHIVSYAYYFLKLWLIHNFDQKKPIILLNDKLINRILKMFRNSDNRGKKSLPTNTDESRQHFFNTEWNKTGFVDHDIINTPSFTQLMKLQAKTMMVCIKNNIVMHFFKYIRRYVKQYYKTWLNENNLHLGNAALNTAVTKVVDDLLGNNKKYLSDPRLHVWIDTIRPSILPKISKNSKYDSDIKKNYSNYINHMIFMCKYFEESNIKQYQFCPLRTTEIPQYIKFDTKCIVEIFLDGKKGLYNNKISESKNEIWSQVFNMDNYFFKHNSKSNKSFYYEITTDGVGASVLFSKNGGTNDNNNDNEQNNNNENINLDIDPKLPLEKTRAEHYLEIEKPYYDFIINKYTPEFEHAKHILFEIKQWKTNYDNDLKPYRDITKDKNISKQDPIFINAKKYIDKKNAETLIDRKSIEVDKKLANETIKRLNKILKPVTKRLSNLEIQVEVEKAVQNNPKEFPYITHMTESQLLKIVDNNKNVVFCDPGKNDLVTMFGIVKNQKIVSKHKRKNKFKFETSVINRENRKNGQKACREIIKQKLKEHRDKFLEKCNTIKQNQYHKLNPNISNEQRSERRIEKKLLKCQRKIFYDKPGVIETDPLKKCLNEGNYMKFNEILNNQCKVIDDMYEKIKRFESDFLSKSVTYINPDIHASNCQYTNMFPDLTKHENFEKKSGEKYGYYQYSKNRRKFESRQKIFEKKLTNLRSRKIPDIDYRVNGEKIEMSIIDFENLLTKNECNSKSANYVEFLKYVKLKLEISRYIRKPYSNLKFRKYKWYALLNRKRSETSMIREIKEKFGHDALIIYGDCSITHQLKNNAPTPNIGLKRMMRKHFEVLHINEYNTSKICYKTGDVCGNMYVKKLTKRIINGIEIEKFRNVKVHSVLTYAKGEYIECLNRDKNAVRNMKKIYESWMRNRTRPSKYGSALKLGTSSIRIEVRKESISVPSDA